SWSSGRRKRAGRSAPEARKMKQSDGGWAPSYNVQTSTDAKHKILVAVTVTQAANDQDQLQPASQQMETNTGSKPQRVAADGGYASRGNVQAMADQQIEFVAPWPEAESRQAGKVLAFAKQHRHHKQDCRIYHAAEQDCASCEQQRRCCGRQAARQLHQVQETAAMQAYLERIQQAESKERYKQRSEVAETRICGGKR
ncbi:MAG TPA: transposase, partial [Bryobacteraceae bacterium]|nr:transposase [Bryobacteraceae bacterium]